MSKPPLIDATKARDLINKHDAIIIDVREPDEFAEEHIPFALSVPLSKFDEVISEFHIKTRKIIFQCASGNRSGQACSIAKKKLQEEHAVFSLDGGLPAWKERGFETITKGRVSKLPLMRQVHIGAGSLVTLAVLIGFTGWTPGFFFAGLFGFSLMMSGVTGWCGMAKFLALMPWNK